MRIFYITYWSINDGLSVSTSQPNVRTLADMDAVTHVDYFTIERTEAPQFKAVTWQYPKTTHRPIVSTPYRWRILTKIMDVWHIRQSLYYAARELRPDLIICRGAITGMFGYWLQQETKLPLIVESFEPHADYMLESGVWRKNGLSYKMEAYFEAKIKQSADFLVTVSHNYQRHLTEAEGLDPRKIAMVPCYVQLEKFQYNEAKRLEFRQRIGAQSDEIVGVYAGKFGSIYYDEEAFDLFKRSYDFFGGKFRLVLLSPSPADELQAKLQNVGFPLDKAFITCALHEEVPAYLSAADFAFSPIKPADCRRFCSPIKDGEYWACGLPFLIPDGVGDDSDIIKQQGGGAIFDINNAASVQSALQRIASIIQRPDYRSEMRALALQHRHFDLQQRVYQHILAHYIS